ncbi:hypothetical protein DFH09DRAFT_1319814 [Mycena vulgaris]|nr:hypothetical protein DFH09DRAFT_1319814 [Mycena vulgaris]
MPAQRMYRHVTTSLPLIAPAHLVPCLSSSAPLPSPSSCVFVSFTSLLAPPPLSKLPPRLHGPSLLALAASFSPPLYILIILVRYLHAPPLHFLSPLPSHLAAHPVPFRRIRRQRPPPAVSRASRPPSLHLTLRAPSHHCDPSVHPCPSCPVPPHWCACIVSAPLASSPCHVQVQGPQIPFTRARIPACATPRSGPISIQGSTHHPRKFKARARARARLRRPRLRVWIWIESESRLLQIAYKHIRNPSLESECPRSQVRIQVYVNPRNLKSIASRIFTLRARNSEPTRITSRLDSASGPSPSRIGAHPDSRCISPRSQVHVRVHALSNPHARNSESQRRARKLKSRPMRIASDERERERGRTGVLV